MSLPVENEAVMRDARIPHRFAVVEPLRQGDEVGTSCHRSLMFFTIHKCASAYVGQILWDLAASQGIVPVDIDGAICGNACSIGEEDYLYYFSMHKDPIPRPRSQHEIERLQRFFRSHGMMYGPLRSATAAEVVPDFDRFTSILMLRDPRDALTSLYYSIAYSHGKPANAAKAAKIQASRQVARDGTIDQFVLSRAAEWRWRYQRYLDTLVGKRGVTLLKYENMVTDFPTWFDQLTTAWALELSPQTRAEFLVRDDFQVDQEDIMSHKRQVTPGDHRRKLQRATIRQLNECLAESLETLGYRRD